MTSKEALEQLEQYITNEKGRLSIFIKLYFDIIKQDLERLENENETLNTDIDNLIMAGDLMKDYILKVDKEIEKLKKAIYIVYMKTVDLELLKDCFELENGLEIYNNKVCFLQELVELEYELLKEVLGE